MRTRNHLGFTLIELMIALTISLLVVAALTSVYSSTRQTNRIQAMQERLTQDGRFSLSMLQRMISQAGFRASPATSPLAGPVTGSASNITLKFEPDSANIMGCDGQVVTVTGVQTIAIQLSSGKLTCGTTDWIAASTGGAGTEVVDFQLKYGKDTAASPNTLDAAYKCGTNGDCVADSYANSAAAGDQVVAVKACLILKSEAKDASVVKPGAVQDCGGTDISGSQTDNQLYRSFHTTVQIRNR